MREVEHVAMPLLNDMPAEPVVQRGRAREEWDIGDQSLEDLLLPLTTGASAKAGMLDGVFVSDTSTKFIYSTADKPLQDYLRWSTPYVTSSMPTSAFLSSLQQADQPRGSSHSHNNMYFSGNLSHPVLQGLQQRFPPLPGLSWGTLPEQSSDNRRSWQGAEQFYPTKSPAPRHSRFFWAGTPDVYTCFHYDDALNIYTQIYGRKTFRLIDPVYYWRMYLFPRDHPRCVYA